MTTLRTPGDGSFVPTSEDPPYLRLGGVEGVTALVEAFYDAMEAHEPELTALHRCDAPGRVSRQSRDHFASFLVYWLGGPAAYLETRGHPRLRMRHGHVAVNEAMRDAWLRSMQRALDGRGVDGGVRRYLDQRFAEVADFLRNTGG
ncbi:MAG: cyanoglobin [Myxococcaceae bacterium]|jgi:hemoglobin|nr:cyanoglobin [Myxococcaceae bacterium]